MRAWGGMLVAVALAAGLSATAAAGPREDGLAAYERQDWVTAFGLLRPLAEQGDAAAQDSLGRLYLGGLGVARDDAAGAGWLLAAARQGRVEAQFIMGGLYLRGVGVPQNDDAAALWWLRAAQQNHAAAQFALGRMYQDGRGARQDDGEAATWIRRAADQGLAEAQYSLGGLYLNGTGLKQDFAQAARWYRLAADRGFAPAQGSLGYLYEKGWGVAKDDVQAHQWYSLAIAGYDAAETGPRDKTVKLRDALARRMTPAQIAKAKKLAGSRRGRREGRVDLGVVERRVGGGLAAVLLLMAAAPGPLAGQTVELPETVPDWADQRELRSSIMQPGREADDRVIAWVERHQQALGPAYFLWLADRLVESDPDRALDWFFLGFLRLAYEERRCGGPSEMSPLMENITIVASNTYGYAQRHPGDWAKAHSRVLNGPDLFQPPAASLPPCSEWGRQAVSLPESDLPALQQQVRDEFVRGIGLLTARQAKLDRIMAGIRIEVVNGDASCPATLPISVTVTNSDTSTVSAMKIRLLARRIGEEVDAYSHILTLETQLLSGERRHRCFGDSRPVDQQTAKPLRDYEWRPGGVDVTFAEP